MSELLSAAWWSLAGQRAARSFLVGLLPFLPAIVAGDTTALLAGLSAGALLAVLSIATSWVNLPEVDGTPRPWWAAALDRVVRTFAQAFLANIPAAAVLLSDVDWQVVLTNAAASAAGSLVLALISVLPESVPAAIPESVVVETVDAEGRVVAGPASPFETGTVMRDHV
ncbi:hypothetical protein GXB85_04765 [Cellulomonas sp. APG4]|uniref:holin n=1 Tax=Cellulomonas sp. APG4 TaxID=1538656 RepID=UPI001379D921|nr:holin [Cellulomonas sp. APG4]NCT90266.1 hypothetical protein [Cellulomonas sp. APG4]